MSQVLVNFRMDAEDKKGMEDVCKELGMSMSTAFTIFAKKMRRERRIPFDVSVDPFYSDANLAHLDTLAAAEHLRTIQLNPKASHSPAQHHLI